MAGMDTETKLRQGHLGIKLASGEQVLTVSGRTTTPFPRLCWGSTRKVNATLKRVTQWLLDNALAEADARDLPAYDLRGETSATLSPSDKAIAELMLFDRAFLEQVG